MTTTTTAPVSHDNTTDTVSDEMWTPVLCGEFVVYPTAADEVAAVDAHEADCETCKDEMARLDRL